MSPTDNKNTALSPKKQAPDYKLADELQGKILDHMYMAIRFGEMATDHSEIYDNYGFNHCVEQFVLHAKDVSNLLNKLRKARGLLD
jgi:hypothetical protein